MKYAIGVDFGTLSARAIVIDEHGNELAESVMEYPHGVMETQLPGGAQLGVDWALQHPGDYLLCLEHTVLDATKQAGLQGEDIAGIGIDFTSCTVLPVLKDGTPLCMLPEYQNIPHAYPKLWKHHAAQYCADRFNEVASQRGESWLPYYGGKISSEWAIPKALQILSEAPEVYRAMDLFIEGGDWIVWQLCGSPAASACNAGYKAQWRYGEGYPSSEFFKALDPYFEHFADKLLTDIFPLGQRAGFVTEAMARRCGLCTGTAVAVGIIDAHASVPACGIDGPGKMLIAMGTSSCHLLMSREEKGVPGTCGIVRDGILPGLYAYEAGQSCVGDHFSWFIDNCLPQSYAKEAGERGLNPHQLLREKTSAKQPGESGLVALDWWNGARSTLMDFDLSGAMIGMNLSTKPEDIYRALIEATAYGTRNIIEAFTSAGVPVDELYAGGGIARKDPFAMQIYADICNREITIVDSNQSGALGAAILGLAAAGQQEDIYDIVRRVGRTGQTKYIPNPEHVAIYDQLFEQYMLLHDYFGKEHSQLMHLLKSLRHKSQPSLA